MDAKPYRSTFLSHVEIYVSDYVKTIRFYDKILIPLGWRRLVCQKSHTTYSDGAMKIVFCPTEEKYLQFGYHRKRIGLNHLAFYAPSKEAVDQIYERVLKPERIECLYEKKPSGDPDYYAIFFEDPDRMKVEVVYSPGYCSPEHWTNQLKDDFDPYSAIVDLMMEEIKSAKVKQVSLEATITAQNFYRKVGFVDAGPETTVEISGTPIRCYPMKMEL